jgi:peptide/nickel transport system ATP-binding protein
MIFQEPMTSFGPMHTFGNQIAEAIRLHFNISKKEAIDRALDSLKSVGMPRPEKVIKQYPHQISGGMRQRAMIAMAISCMPSLLIADEPTTALDVSTEAQILELISDRQKDLGMAVLFISHNLGVIARMADYVIVMYLGKIVEQSDVKELFEEPKHPYTQALLNSVPRIEKDGNKKRLEVLKGNIPDPYNHPKGCSFHTRCSKFMSGICDVVVPCMTVLERNSKVACHLYNSHQKTNDYDKR